MSWEAVIMAGSTIVGLVVWLTKIYIKVDMLLDLVEELKTAQNKFANKEDMYKELGRLEHIADAAHKRIDGLQDKMSFK